MSKTITDDSENLPDITYNFWISTVRSKSESSLVVIALSFSSTLLSVCPKPV